MVAADQQAIETVAARLKECQRVCCLTGAGISAESGVPTFRGAGGLWQGHRAEDLATPEAFERDSAQVWAFYNYRRNLLMDCAPNPGHLALVELERRVPEWTLITQNVDGLHQAAGSKRVIPLHGSIWTVRCTACAQEIPDHREALDDNPRCAACNGLLRPGVVWFGESLPTAALDDSDDVIRSCEALLVVGTSAVVQPAGSLAFFAKSAGAFVVEVNPEATPISDSVDVTVRGPAGGVLPRIVEALQ